MKKWLTCFLFLCSLFFPGLSRSAFSSETTPPPNLPVTVECGLTFLHLVSINEHDETFTADIYVSAEWQDPRLAYDAPKDSYPKTYIGGACTDKMKEIWLPDLEFVNTGLPEITNITLTIHPDGKVRLDRALTAVFRNSFDYTKLPFDEQKIEIIISSFSWNDNVVVFKVNPENIRFGEKLQPSYAAVKILNLEAHVVRRIAEKSVTQSAVSEVVVTLKIKRNPVYYIFQVFFPLLVVIGLCTSVFFIRIDEIDGVIQIICATVLLFIATKFVINQDLPRIGYLTLVDKVFFVSYAYTGVVAILCIAAFTYWQKKDPRSEKIIKIGRIVAPLLYLLACTILLLLA